MCLSAVQGKTEQRSKMYIDIHRRVAEVLTQKCAKNIISKIQMYEC